LRMRTGETFGFDKHPTGTPVLFCRTRMAVSTTSCPQVTYDDIIMMNDSDC
jgi:hypothetical protein